MISKKGISLVTALGVVVVIALLAIGYQQFWPDATDTQDPLTQQPVQSSPNALLPVAKITVSPSEFDFGNIVQSNGPVSTTFSVTNIGQESLIINRLSTSCGCTTATMILDPLTPGESREMHVAFDPMTHPDQLGKIDRVVYLQTSDPSTPEIEINLSGNVIR